MAHPNPITNVVSNASASPTVTEHPDPTGTGNGNSTPTTTTTGSRTRQRKVQVVDEEKANHHIDREVHNVLSPGAESTHSRLSQLAHYVHFEDNKEELLRFWDQFTRKGKRKIGVKESLHNLAFSSWLNLFLIFIPFSWAAHFLETQHNEEIKWGPRATFVLSFFAIIPLQRLFDYGGEQMTIYLGKDLGDLVAVTLSNAVEATLAIILLLKCELVLLKSTIIGVVILHLLLVPGTAFVIGGARIIQQDLHPHLTQLNHSMLTVGVLATLLPVAFFTALNTSFSPSGTPVSVVTDEVRGKILQLSRGIAILLLIVYICSRIYLHNPPGEDNAFALQNAPNAPDSLKEHVQRLRDEEPEVNQYVCIAMLAICIALMAATAEWLVSSIEFVRESAQIQEEWFGLILLPIVSFAADGAVAGAYFIRHMLRHIFQEPVPPTTLARAEAIDLSIQFVLFWMPFLVLLGWWTDRPLTLLFDLFEVAILIGACFLVNYVTADAKTNWAEGMSMVMFYIMIVVCSWFYAGQPEVNVLSQCGSVVEALAKFASSGTPE